MSDRKDGTMDDRSRPEPRTVGEPISDRPERRDPVARIARRRFLGGVFATAGLTGCVPALNAPPASPGQTPGPSTAQAPAAQAPTAPTAAAASVASPPATA